MAHYDTRPLILAAVQYDPASRRMIEGVTYHHGPGDDATRTVGPLVRVTVETPAGVRDVLPGDWIIVAGDDARFCCPPDLFALLFAPYKDGT